MEQGLSWEVESDEYLLMSVRGIASISVRAFLLHLCVYRWGPERELMKNMCCAGSSHSLVIAVTLGHMLADMHQDWQLETVDWYPTGTEVSFIQHCNQHVCFSTAVLLHCSYFNNFDEKLFVFFFGMSSRRTSGKTEDQLKHHLPNL